MRIVIAALTCLCVATACTVEDSAFSSTPTKPATKTYVIDFTRKYTSGDNPVGKREFRVALKPTDTTNEYTAVLTELLGEPNTSFFTMSASALDYEEFDTKTSAYGFKPPIELARFPLAVTDHWDLDSKANWDDENGQTHSLKLTGTVSADRIAEVKVNGRSVRSMVMNINVELDAEVGVTVPDALGGGGATFTRIKNTYVGELWFAPSYGLLVGGKYKETHDGDKAHLNFESDTSWAITNLTK